MQDRTIDNAPIAFRKQIIRQGSERLEHVEALKRTLGLPVRPYRVFAQSESFPGAPADAACPVGPAHDAALSAAMQAGRGQDSAAARNSPAKALTALKRRGLVWNASGVWVAFAESRLA